MKYPLMLLASAFLLMGFSIKPAGNMPQKSDSQGYDIPKSNDPMWARLAKTKIVLNEKTGMYSAKYTVDTTELAGQTVTVMGFMMPIEAGATHQRFLLTRTAPSCPFCLPGGPEEFIDVQMKKPIKWEDDSVTIKGTFGLINDGEMGLFFAIKDAVQLESGSGGNDPASN